MLESALNPSDLFSQPSIQPATTFGLHALPKRVEDGIRRIRSCGFGKFPSKPIDLWMFDT